MVFTLVGQRNVLNSSWVNQNDVRSSGRSGAHYKTDRSIQISDGGSSESVTGGTESVSLLHLGRHRRRFFSSAQGPPRFLLIHLSSPFRSAPPVNFNVLSCNSSSSAVASASTAASGAPRMTMASCREAASSSGWQLITPIPGLLHSPRHDVGAGDADIHIQGLQCFSLLLVRLPIGT